MIVIADDITGAAEIAGIAFAHGQQVRLLCSSSQCCDNVTAQTTVIATDTRSMTEDEAVAETRRIASTSLFATLLSPIFKKTDSALRGHVVAELTTMMQATGMHRAVFLPANPSKGRIIRNGTYYIDGLPIAETDFSFDPEYPATTSVLRERFPDAEGKGILMPDAESEDDIRQIVAQYNDGNTLFAGAADLFRTVLYSTTGCIPPPNTQQAPLHSDWGRLLVVCGSTQSRPLNLDIPVAPMPIGLYDGDSDISQWDTTDYANGKSLVLTIPHHHRTGKAAAMHLRSITAQKVRELVAIHRPDHLVIEGGATAWATLQALGWSDFAIASQLAPGVVQMRAKGGTLITLKPGSYPWKEN